MIKVCGSCSNVNMDELKSLVSEDQFTVKCLGHCDGHDGKSFGIIDGDLIVEETPEAFVAAVKSKLNV